MQSGRSHGLGRSLPRLVVGQTSRSGCPLGRVLQDPLLILAFAWGALAQT
jgi:hypothetical protein